MKQILLLIAVGVFVVVLFAWTLRGFDASAISAHGWIALALGTVLSLALGGGLMALMFFSARRGYDDRIQRDEPDEPER